MSKSSELYKKALNKYQNGFIDEAINICEEAMSIDMKNKAAINLKGLLYYFKGDLEGAKALWKLNYEVNNDGAARKYLQGLKEDEERLSYYTLAVASINNNDVKQAIKLLNQCEDSDYNCINVNNLLAVSYINIGQYEKASISINKVLELDFKNDIANKNKKLLVKNGISKTNFKKSSNYNGKLLLVFVFLIGAGILGTFSVKNIQKKLVSNNNNKIVNLQNINESTRTPDSKETKGQIEDKKEDMEKIETKAQVSTEVKNQVEKAEIKPEARATAETTESKETSDKNTLPSEKNINNSFYYTEKDGIKYYYYKGKNELKINRNYDSAIENFNKAYTFGESNDLYPHVVYMLGAAYDAKKEFENASKYYIEYLSKYPKGDYEQQILYRLCIINKDTNVEEAKKYANRIANEYGKSQYNNSIVKAIISS